MAVEVRQQLSKIFNLRVEICIFIFARQLQYCVDLSEKSVRTISLDNDSRKVSVRQLDNCIIPGS